MHGLRRFPRGRRSGATLREHQSEGIERAAREVAERAYAYGPEATWAAQANAFAAIIRRNLEVGE